MKTGVTFYDWTGKPALIQDGQARAVFAIGGTWGGAALDDGVAFASVRFTGLSIGRDPFESRLSVWASPSSKADINVAT